jgi:6-pyruvoyltetrahydropterin/6-carboxytetrahydropterin synthase
MTTITATRRIQFCAGHRVWKHESKCRNLHGHNYVALFEARAVAGELDDIGRVIDFSVLKERLGGWVDANWDHGFIYHEEDVDTIAALDAMGPAQRRFGLQANPTAENMARFLLEVVAPIELHGTGVEVVQVTLWETENCYAVARLEN